MPRPRRFQNLARAATMLGNPARVELTVERAAGADTRARVVSYFIWFMYLFHTIITYLSSHIQKPSSLLRQS